MPVAIQRGPQVVWRSGVGKPILPNAWAKFVMLLQARGWPVLFCGEGGVELACVVALFRVAGNHGGCRMGRFFFHSVTVDGEMKDDVGVEVDDRSLHREAIEAVFELQSEFGVRDEVADVLGFRVVNEVGRTVLELPLRAMAYSSH
jgi:hypothetical protein